MRELSRFPPLPAAIVVWRRDVGFFIYANEPNASPNPGKRQNLDTFDGEPIRVRPESAQNYVTFIVPAEVNKPCS